MPENQSAPRLGVGAPPLPEDRRAALGLPPPAVGLPLRDRVAAVADALGTSASRLVIGCLVGALVLGALAWTLAAPVRGASSQASRDEALPRAAGGAAPGGVGAAAGGAGSASGGQVVVAAAGAVVRPGVYRVAGDARVVDVIEAAGGTAPDADLDQVNLAAPVADGERVYVPRRGEQLGGVALGAGLVGGGSGPGGSGPAQPVNLNSATVEQLDALPGIGPSTASAIVAWRKENGRFKRVDDLLNVRGIGPAKLDALRPLVRV